MHRYYEGTDIVGNGLFIEQPRLHPWLTALTIGYLGLVVWNKFEIHQIYSILESRR
jgi:hypothetical protein